MKRYVMITIIIYFILGIFFSVYLVFFHVDPESEEMEKEGIRVVYNDPEAFAEALKTDGRIQAFGKLQGNLEISDINDLENIEDLDFNAEDKEEKFQKTIKKIPPSFCIVFFASEIVMEDMEKYISDKERRKKLKKSYEVVQELRPKAYDSITYLAEEIEFLGQTLHLPLHLSYKLGKLKDGRVDAKGKEGEKVIEARFIKNNTPAWLDIYIENGEIQYDTLEFYDETSEFSAKAKTMSGNTSAWEMILGVFIFFSLLCGVTIFIESKIFNR